MGATEFFCPHTLAEALELLAKYQQNAVIVNGGTDIVEKIAHGRVEPDAIIYIQDIAELKGITQEAGYVRIGGAATYNEINASPLSRQYPAIRQAIDGLGSPPIRVLGTPAGNIGTAVPAADCNVAMLALDASLVLASKYGECTVPIKDIFVGYGKTQLKTDELIKEIRLPLPAANSASAFLKLTRRKAQDIAQVSVGVMLAVEGEICRAVNIALGAVNATAVRAYSLEKLMVGKKVAEGAQLLKDSFPAEASLRSPRNRAYKSAVIGVLTERAIMQAYAAVLGGKK